MTMANRDASLGQCATTDPLLFGKIIAAARIKAQNSLCNYGRMASSPKIYIIILHLNYSQNNLQEFSSITAIECGQSNYRRYLPRLSPMPQRMPNP